MKLVSSEYVDVMLKVITRRTSGLLKQAEAEESKGKLGDEKLVHDIKIRIRELADTVDEMLQDVKKFSEENHG